ncbi:MAG: acetylornithine/succinylornithine family transaminase [Alphaproteobacteria bacterium]|nr:acetylornithine/succinylornithine family transaminase [Alphaproteobacteria bacterium]
MTNPPHHILPVYSPPEEVFVRGEGVWLTTDTGERYLDFIAGIAVNALGHAHPKLVGALTEQAGKLWHLSNMFRVAGQERLSDKYCVSSFAEVVFFTNSGTEAIEGLLKIARKYHSAGGQPERIDIIGFKGAFHGRSYGGINAAGNPNYVDGFGPPLPGFKHAEFNDLESVKALINPDTFAAILVEPVQGEGGVRAGTEEFIRGLRELCDAHGALLLFDEVQCGAGRTGKLWAHEWYGVTPDAMAVAKGVGGGFPLGAFMATREAARGMIVGTHGSTYGGNPLAMAVGEAAFDELSNPHFLERVRAMANHLGQSLEGLKDRHPELVLDVRGKGLLRGLKLSTAPKPIQAAARARKLLVGVAGDNVLRLAPPLIVDESHIAQAIDTLDAALNAIHAEAAA